MRATRLLAPLTVLLFLCLPAQSQDALTPVIAAPLRPTTYAVPGTDNKHHLVYELVITNTGTAPATLQKIEVLAADDTHKVLATFEGPSLLSRLRTAGRGPELTSAQIAFSATRLLLVDLTLDQGTHPPATLLHRFTLLAAGPPGSPADQAFPQTYTIAPIAVSTDIAVLGSPLSGKHWVALNGCCEAGGVHRGTSAPVNGEIYVAQRFAIDWMLLDANGRFFHGDSKDVKAYSDYGAKVIAVADGTVVDTLSTQDDQVPPTLPDPKTITIENVDGNHIVLDLGHNRYAFYAHLQKGSLLVRNGDRVKRGQPLALLGNTGNTSAPHLHFHLMNGRSALGSSGLPYVIDHFELAGQLPSKQFDKTGLDGEWNQYLSAPPSTKTLEFPLDLTVIDF
jgi:murein DD-endopeptidase MepM/ murein hydrolase activator NlpD